MFDWNLFAIHRVGIWVFLSFWRQVNDQLMSEEIEIHPVVTAPAFTATENLSIEFAVGRNVVDRNGQVKW